jgi:SP family facilitated glucose transporter-like MFS transporter 8
MLGTIVVSIVSTSLGTMIGYPTKALPQLQSEPNNAVKLTEEEGSGFAAILTLSGVIFSPLGGFLSGNLGRKNIILFAAPIVASGWLIIALAQNKAMLFIGNIMVSMSTAQATNVMPYISGKLTKKVFKFIWLFSIAEFI